MAKYSITHGIEIATDFVPEVFGRLTTQGPAFKLKTVCPSRTHRIPHQVVKCSCSEDAYFVVSRFSLLRKNATRSCGCYCAEALLASNTTHGKTGTQIYRVYRSMLERCYDPNNKRYSRYGGRGIYVEAEWLGDTGFETWYADMGDRPPGHTIERKRNDGPYCKENCIWASWKTQANNTSRNVFLTFQGKTQTIAQWSEEVGIKASTLNTRHRAGWDTERMLTEKPRPSHNKSRRKKTQQTQNLAPWDHFMVS